MTKKRINNTVTDKVLTIVFVLSMILGFYLVHIVSASYEQIDENEVLFRSDSSTHFPQIDIVDIGFNSWEYWATGYYFKTDTPNYNNFTKSPVYLGNNTWSYSVNGSTESSVQFALYVIELPNLDKWIINEMNINQTVNTDSDLTISWSITSLAKANELVYSESGIRTTGLYNDVSAGGSSIYYNVSEDIPLSTALNIHDKAQDSIQHYLLIQVYDTNQDGLGAFAWNIDMSIEGKPIDNYNLVQQLELGLGVASVINIMVIIYMTDSIDLGGTFNDIPDKKRRR